MSYFIEPSWILTPNLHVTTYMRKRDFYSNFINKWNKMLNLEKENYIFGNGRTSLVNCVDKSSVYLANLTGKSSVNNSIDLTKNVVYKNLEYS